MQKSPFSGMPCFDSPRSRSGINKRPASPYSPLRSGFATKVRKVEYSGGRSNINAILFSCQAAPAQPGSGPTRGEVNCRRPQPIDCCGGNSSTSQDMASPEPGGGDEANDDSCQEEGSNDGAQMVEESQADIEPASHFTGDQTAKGDDEVQETSEETEEGVELPELRLLSWKEMGTRQFEVARLLRLKIDGSNEGMVSIEGTVLSIRRFILQLHASAARREDGDTGALYQELLTGAGPNHLVEGAERLRDAVRIKVQDKKDVETAEVAVTEASELFYGLRSHSESRSESLPQCWRSLSV